MTTKSLAVSDKFNQFYNLQNPKQQRTMIEYVEGYMSQFKELLSKINAASLAYSVMDLVDRELKNRTKKETLSCRKGCSYCCHVEVGMTKAEAELIVAHCEEQGIEINKELLEIQLPLTMSQRAKHEHSRCAFLSKENTCTIYEVRPFSCRKYFVKTPPELCDAKNKVTQVAIFFEVYTEVIVTAFNNVCPEMGTMSQMLLPLLKNQ